MPARVPLAAMLTAVALAACSSSRAPDPAQPTSPTRYGLFSQLKALGSGIWGRARVVDRGDGVEVTLTMVNLPMGPFRVAFTETPNCSSPNGFSAGQPWAPAGRDPRTLVQPLYNAKEGSTETSVFVRGVHVAGPDGVQQRSITIYAGDQVTDARPDVPNNRVACGTFDPVQPFF